MGWQWHLAGVLLTMEAFAALSPVQAQTTSG